MEFLLGSLSTIVTAMVVLYTVKFISKRQSSKIKIFYSQSNIYERIKPAIPFMPPKPRESQSINHLKSNMVRIAILDGTAYWISNNSVMMASIDENGFVDKESAKPIDTMGMDRVELDKLSFIVERLTEGNNDDSGNTRH